MLETLPINLLDIAIFVVLLLSAILAFMRGFVQEVLGIAAWVGAALTTLYLFPFAQQLARRLTTIELVADIAAGVVLFLLALVLFSLVSRMAARRVQSSSLGALDRTLGLLFGLVRGAVLVALAWIVFSWAVAPEDRPAWITEAKTLPLVSEGAEALRALVPEELRLRGERAAETAAERGQEVFDGGAAVQRLLQPPVAPKDGAGKDGLGYNDEQRREMQRLNESLQ